MKKKRSLRGIGLWIVAILAVAYILPSFAEEYLPVWYNNFFKNRISYGLDIKGGLELEYTVDWKKAVKDYCGKIGEGIHDQFLTIWTKKKIEAVSDEDRTKYGARMLFGVERPYSRGRLRLIFEKAADAALLDNAWLKKYNLNEEFGVAERFEENKRRVVVLKLLDAKQQEIKKRAVEQTLEIIRKRAEGFGLAEPDVRKSGDSNIVVQLPGLKKSQMKRVKDQMGRPAALTFRIVDEDNSIYTKVGDKLTAYKKEYATRSKTLKYMKRDAYDNTYFEAGSKIELVRFVRWINEQVDEKGNPLVPQGRMFAYKKSRDMQGKKVVREYWRTLYLIAKVQLDGKHVTKANVFYDSQSQQPYVSLDLDSIGGRRFEKVTEKYTKKLLAIMLDEDVESAPQIREVIGGGRVRVDLGGGGKEILEEAQALVIVLTHGAYKAPVYAVAENEVGPQLGRDAVNKGKFALMIGGFLVLIFIGLEYRLSGMVANVALVFNVLLILAVLVSFNSFLTLPGLAGIILTIGMAVDANVIIFERIREELRAGRSDRAALDTGYEKALWTVLDANITTALAGLVLLNLTSGTVYGFAVTLLIGIGSSVFTAFFVTRMILYWMIERGVMKKFSI